VEMPRIRELKRTAATEWLFEQYKIRGPCLKVGAEIWEVENINVKVGLVEKIGARGIYIKRADGTVFRIPKESILFVEPVTAAEPFVAPEVKDAFVLAMSNAPEKKVFVKKWQAAVERCVRQKVSRGEADQLLKFDIGSRTWKEYVNEVMEKGIFNARDKAVRDYLWGKRTGWSLSSSSDYAGVLKGIMEKLTGSVTTYHEGLSEASLRFGLAETPEYLTWLNKFQVALIQEMRTRRRLQKELVKFFHIHVSSKAPPSEVIALLEKVLDRRGIEALIADSLGRMKRIGDYVIDEAIKAGKLRTTKTGKITVFRGTHASEVPELYNYFTKKINEQRDKWDGLKEWWAHFDLPGDVNVSLNSISSVSYTPHHWLKFGDFGIEMEIDRKDIIFGEHVGRLLAEDELNIADKKARVRSIVGKWPKRGERGITIINIEATAPGVLETGGW